MRIRFKTSDTKSKSHYRNFLTFLSNLNLWKCPPNIFPNADDLFVFEIKWERNNWKFELIFIFNNIHHDPPWSNSILSVDRLSLHLSLPHSYLGLKVCTLSFSTSLTQTDTLFHLISRSLWDSWMGRLPKKQQLAISGQNKIVWKCLNLQLIDNYTPRVNVAPKPKVV